MKSIGPIGMLGGGSSRFGQAGSKLKGATGAWLVALLLLVAHGLVEWQGFPVNVRWHLAFGLNREVFWGEPWRVGTYAFLHGNWLHVLLNAAAVVLFGAGVQHVVGLKGFLKVTLVGILGGAFGHLALSAGGPDASLLVGFSAACVGLLIFTTTLSPESRMWPIPVSGRSLGLGILVAEFLLALMDPRLGIPGMELLGRGLVEAGMGSWFLIGHACHFGGGLAGWLMARWLLRGRVTLDRLRRERARREAKEKLG
jgi:membrane associated rhomboid family serine protease